MSDQWIDALEAIGRMVRNHPENTARILAKHGGIIEIKAAVLTPVDTGLLRRANEYYVAELSGYGHDEVTLTIENRMVYAHYQHENVLHHNQPKARDHFISIPFEDELTPIVDEIVQADLQEART